jgi:hypothetical protein
VRKKMEKALLDYCHKVEDECRELDTGGFLLISKNTSDLLRIQEVMSSMEGREYT